MLERLQGTWADLGTAGLTPCVMDFSDGDGISREIVLAALVSGRS